MSHHKLAEILLIDDNEGDIELAKEAFQDIKFRNTLRVVEDGDAALDYLFKRNGFETVATPDIIFLDINLPGTDGKEVLQVIKRDPQLKTIPVIVLTGSATDKDILKTYNLNANCYIVKPVSGIKFISVIKEIEHFWVDVVTLPPHQ